MIALGLTHRAIAVDAADGLLDSEPDTRFLLVDGSVKRIKRLVFGRARRSQPERKAVMLYRADWSMPNNIHRNDIFSRFIESGEDPTYQLPDGLVMIGRWHDISGLRGTSIWETDEVELLIQWMQHWNDKLQIDITPCVDDEAAARIVSKALNLS